jgi:hypothetical protein
VAYEFLPELAASPIDQISIETAQSKLDLSVLRALPYKHASELVAAPDCDQLRGTHLE